MAEVINMPRLSDTMEEGTVASWLKKVGDKIEEGDILAEIETDKATMEFESFNEGTLLHIGLKEGETAKVDTLLAIIGDKDEDISELLKGSNSEAKEDNSEAKEEKSEDKKDKTETDSSQESEDKADAPKADSKKESKAKSGSDTKELPEGVTVVTMPRLSDTMVEGTVASWLKKVGDKVTEGDILAEIETDKATMEFESFYEGTLLYIGVKEGETMDVDALLAIIGPEGTEVESIAKNYKSNEPSEVVEHSEGNHEVKEETASETKKEDPKQEAKSSASSSSSEDNGRLFVSPLARKMAEEKGIELNQVEGSGENGRIVKRDIENFKPSAAKQEAPKADAASASAPVQKFVASGEENSEDVKNSQVRKIIAKRLSESKFTAPHYYLNVEFDMDNAIAMRVALNADPNVKVSYNDIIVKAVALALKKHPQVNSRWFDDHIQINNHVHIGVAVAIPDGLVVPVVRFANEQSLLQINAAVKDYATRARDRKLLPKEIEGSTFTISNLGNYGIESFTSIINQPNSAILSVGAIVAKPVVKNGAVVAGNTMKLTMACDHRTVDGATGAQFLQTLKGYIENPMSMLL